MRIKKNKPGKSRRRRNRENSIKQYKWKRSAAVKNETEQDDFIILKDVITKLKQKPEVEPIICLTETGFISKLKWKGDRLSKKVKPLLMRNVHEFLLKGVLGHSSPYSPKWAEIERPQNITRSVLLVFEDLPKSILIQNLISLSSLDIFKDVMQAVSPKKSFIQELTNLTHSDNNTVAIETEEVDRNSEKISKIKLMLSAIQLCMECYNTFPPDVFEHSKGLDYVFTKDSYKHVTENSPLFALDCEMCRTEQAGQELTRIAVVNENKEVIYETLVKPKSKIIDYATKYSGITKAMLENVTTTLEDVQNKLRILLPPDAILCGHSLNFDLRALKMSHPYCIDTSIIYNSSGLRPKKDGLKTLARIHLKEKIQCSKDGHHPVEDAIATMKLVQLKLENSLPFGDACIETKEHKNNNDNKLNVDTVSDELKPDNKIINIIELISQFDKKICLIGNEQKLNMYGSVLPDSVTKIKKSSVKKIIKSTLNHMEDFALTICHIDFNSSEKFDIVDEFNRIVKLIYDSCSNRTMFMVHTSKIDRLDAENNNSAFMATIKNDSMDIDY